MKQGKFPTMSPRADVIFTLDRGSLREFLVCVPGLPAKGGQKMPKVLKPALIMTDQPHEANDGKNTCLTVSGLGSKWKEIRKWIQSL